MTIATHLLFCITLLTNLWQKNQLFNTDTVSAPHHYQISSHQLILTLSHHAPSQVRQTLTAYRLCHFQLRPHPAADCGWYIDFIQCRVIVINSRKFRCHGTVNSSIYRNHHMTDNIWFLHTALHSSHYL